MKKKLSFDPVERLMKKEKMGFNLKTVYEILETEGKVNTKKEFAALLGVHEAYLSQLMNNPEKINSTFIAKVHEKTGYRIEEIDEGSKLSVFKKRQTNSGKLIPVYSIDFLGGTGAVFEQGMAPDYFIDIPELSGCVSFFVYGDSMKDSIRSGTQVFALKVDRWMEFMELGEIYCLVLQDGRRICKRARRGASDDVLKLVSDNADYDEVEINKDMIAAVYQVYGWIERKK